MKKHGIILTIYFIFTAVYIAMSLILVTERTKVFWIGLIIIIFSILLTAIVTIISIQKRSFAFPIEISIITFSSIYISAVIAINIVLGFLLKTTVNVFVSTHIICFALYAIVILLMFSAKSGIIKQNNEVNSKICEMQIMIYEFEKIKSKLIDMNIESRKKALSIIDSLLEDLRFSEFGTTIDVSDIDANIREMAEMMSSEVDNLIEIKSDDITSFEAIANDIRKIVEDRNTKIKLMKASI